MKSLPSPSDPEAGEALLGSCPRCDLDAEKGALLSRPENGQRSLYQKWIPHWLQIAMLWLNLSALFIVLLGFWLGGYSIVSPKAIDGICFEKTSIFSSAAKSVDLSYHEKTFSELTLQKDNIYRQDASPEVDAAWADLGVHWENFTMPYEDGMRAGMPPGSVRVPAEFGGNLAAGVEVFHQLHCLNLLRKTSHFNFDYYFKQGHVEFSDSSKMLKMHTAHCLDALRQSIMCKADVTPIPLVWVDHRPWMKERDENPFSLPNFQNKHKCRNFDAVRTWFIENQDPRPWADTTHWRPGPGETIIKGEDYQ